MSRECPVTSQNCYNEKCVVSNCEFGLPFRGGWIKTSDRLPAKPGVSRYEHVHCLVYYKREVRILAWNCEHLCWDDESGDDYLCKPTDPTHWMPLPKPPKD